MKLTREVKGHRLYGIWAGNPEGVVEDKERCIIEIWPDGEWVSRQCLRKRGYGTFGLYCKQHSKSRKMR